MRFDRRNYGMNSKTVAYSIKIRRFKAYRKGKRTENQNKGGITIWMWI